ncbi:MAG: hypothetical protein K2Y22_07470 [Candidatus Obscuribacterales bacterium]|nr:hypothetical protein [Candidatus Obscuribacterales bacterium]
MVSPVRFPASKSILLVWILNIFLLGVGNVYASGLSALRWLVIGVLIRIFMSEHFGVLLGAYVVLSIIATTEIAAESALSRPPKKKPKDIQPSYTRSRPKAINAPPESLRSTLKVSHETPPENVNEFTDEFVRSHLQQNVCAQPIVSPTDPDAVNNLGYGDIKAGQFMYDTIATHSDPYATEVRAIERMPMPEPLNYDFGEYKFDSLNYKDIGTQVNSKNAAFACPHCGINGQHDFSFCLSCGHAYAIG